MPYAPFTPGCSSHPNDRVDLAKCKSLYPNTCDNPDSVLEDHYDPDCQKTTLAIWCPCWEAPDWLQDSTTHVEQVEAYVAQTYVADGRAPGVGDPSNLCVIHDGATEYSCIDEGGASGAMVHVCFFSAIVAVALSLQ